MIQLLIILLFIHWACDFTHLSRPYMLKAKNIGKPLGPILHHALVHGALMSPVLFLYAIKSHKPYELFPFCFMLEVISHFIIDTLKGRLNVWAPSLSNPANPFHWYVFGLDQFLHILVVICICSFYF